MPIALPDDDLEKIIVACKGRVPGGPGGTANPASSVMIQGILDDAGSVLPGVLDVLDLPDLAALGTDRPALVCVVPNLHQAGSTEHRRAWQSKLSEKRPPWFRPDEPLTSALLLSWLKQAR